MVDIEVEAGLFFVEGLGAIDVRPRNDDNFELPVHRAASGSVVDQHAPSTLHVPNRSLTSMLANSGRETPCFGM